MNHTPLVSIVIPVFNREKMVSEAVESALAQSHPHIEVVVVDDGSTDGTFRVLQSFGSSIVLVRQVRNKGQSAARNRGISKSRGRYLLFLDSDDVLFPDAVETLWKALDPLERKHPAWRVGYGKRLTCNEKLIPVKTKKKKYYSGHILNQMFTHHFVHSGTYLVRKTAIEEIGGFREDLAVKEDLLVHLLLAAKYKFRFVDQPVVKYRRHTGDRARNNPRWLLEQGARHLDYFFLSNPPADREQKKLRSSAYAAEYLHIAKVAWRSGEAETYIAQWKALCAEKKRYMIHPKYLFRALACQIKNRL